MKGYWIAHVSIDNPEQYQDYMALAPAAFAQYQGKLLVRGGQSQQLEGPTRQRHAVIEFPSYQQALTCYHSAEYQAALAKRQGAAQVEVVIVEGIA